MKTESKLTKNQTKTFGPVFYREHGQDLKIVATVRYDDRCGNGRNTFSITADIKTKLGRDVAGVCCHEEIAKHFPQLAPLIKWHLCSSDGPMHYLANTTYHVGCNPPKLDYARSCAIWPDATDGDLTAPGLEARLIARLPALMAEFRAAVELIGFTF